MNNFVLRASNGFASSELKRLQDVRLKQDLSLKNTVVHYRIRNSKIFSYLLQRELVRISPAQS